MKRLLVSAVALSLSVPALAQTPDYRGCTAWIDRPINDAIDLAYFVTAVALCTDDAPETRAGLEIISSIEREYGGFVIDTRPVAYVGDGYFYGPLVGRVVAPDGMFLLSETNRNRLKARGDALSIDDIDPTRATIGLFFSALQLFAALTAVETDREAWLAAQTEGSRP